MPLANGNLKKTEKSCANLQFENMVVCTSQEWAVLVFLKAWFITPFKEKKYVLIYVYIYSSYNLCKERWHVKQRKFKFGGFV